MGKAGRVIKFISGALVTVFLMADTAGIKTDGVWNDAVKSSSTTLAPQICIGDERFRGHIVYFSGNSARFSGIKNQASLPVISADDLSLALKLLGFKYWDKLAADFRLPLFSPYGKLQILMVTGDGEYAFALRKRIDFSEGSKRDNISINLIEINPFLTKIKELARRDGFSRVIIDRERHTAFGTATSREIGLQVDTYRKRGAGSALFALAIEEAVSQGMQKFVIFNPNPKAFSLYIKQFGFRFIDKSAHEPVIELNLENPPSANPDGSNSWRLPDAAKYRNFRLMDLRGVNSGEFFTHKEENTLYIKDLNSLDPEARLLAAFALAGSGEDNPILRQVFRESAINKNLPLAQRVKAAEYLQEKDREESAYALRNDKEHFERIDRGTLQRYEEETRLKKTVTWDEFEKKIKQISGIRPEEAQDLISRSKKINWEKGELAAVAYALDYLNGAWKQIIVEKLVIGHDFTLPLAKREIAEYIRPEIIPPARNYLYAAVFSWEIIRKLQKKGQVILSGDREWFLLEAFKLVGKNRGYSLNDRQQLIKRLLLNEWKQTTASGRSRKIFERLREMGFYKQKYISLAEMEAAMGLAGLFISSAYDDNVPEFSPGPCYDSRGLSVGIEGNPGARFDGIHLNYGINWAAKYIWAAHLAMYPYITPETFLKTRFDYYYNQSIKKESGLNGIDRRVSYVGVRVQDIGDIEQILELFIPLSIALEGYTGRSSERLTQIWSGFHNKFEEIVLRQNDPQLNEEFFQQARMVRFVELICAYNRNNDFYRQIKELTQETIKSIAEALETEKQRPYFLEQKLKPLKKSWIELCGEVRIKISPRSSLNLEAAVAGTNLLLQDKNSSRKLHITLIPKNVPLAGIKKRYVVVDGRHYWVFKNGIREANNHHKRFAFEKHGVDVFLNLEGKKFKLLPDGLLDLDTGRKSKIRNRGLSRNQPALLFIGSRQYRVARDGLVDVERRKKIPCGKTKKGMLIIQLDALPEHPEVKEFFNSSLPLPEISFSPGKIVSGFIGAEIEQAI